MSIFFYEAPELVIALNRKAIFVNPDDLQIFKELELPADLLKHIKTPAIREDEEQQEVEEDSASSSKRQTEQEQKQKQQAVEKLEPSIRHVRYSPDRQLIVVTTAGHKALLLYKSFPEHAKLLSVRSLARTASAVTFASDSSSVLVTDKSGDCYQYDCLDVEALPRLLLGHLAIVYDVLWTPDTKYIITCDRDDKIRVTNYPQTYDIHTYCLGHKEFVIGMTLLETNILLSASGDGTLRIWNYETGKELHKFELPAPALRLVARKSVDGRFLIGVQLHQPQESIVLHEVTKSNDNGDWNVKQIKLYNFGDTEIGNFCFVNERLYVTAVENEHLTVKVFDAAGETWTPKENWINMIEEQFAKDIYTLEDYSFWYKKRYDNVSEYLERKRQRIVEKEQKKNAQQSEEK